MNWLKRLYWRAVKVAVDAYLNHKIRSYNKTAESPIPPNWQDLPDSERPKFLRRR